MNTSRTLTLAAALAFVTTGAHAATELHHYSFDSGFTDGVGSNDLSASSGTPNITATVSEIAFGSGALNLDQSGTEEYLGFNSAVSFDGSSAWSLSWWSQRASASTSNPDGQSGGIIGTQGTGTDFVFTPNNNAGIGVRLRSTANETDDFGTGANYTTDYVHFAVSYDGAGSATVYRDGVDLGTKSWGGDILLSHVGAITGNQVNSWNGRIDELRIMNGELSVSEVAGLRATDALSGLTQTTLDAVADTYVSSSSGSGNTAQQTNDPNRMISNDSGSNTRYSFVRFDVSSYSDIASARFELIHAVGANGSQEYEVFGLLDSDDDWNEATLTFNNSTNLSGGSVELADVYGGAALAEFADPSATNTPGDLIVVFDIAGGDILDFLNADADGLVTFLIAEKIVGGTDASGDGWVTREGFAANSALAPPRLIIGTSEIPAPASLPAGLAMLALAAARRRRA